jgi:hypothetical protein
VKWGSSEETAKQVLEGKGMKLVHETKTALNFQGQFAGENTNIIILYFTNSQLYMASVAYTTEPNEALSKYEEYSTLLIKKYGEPDKTVEHFLSPYYKGDGYEEQAIRLNKALIGRQWNFSNNTQILIAPTYFNVMLVSIIYTDNVLKNKADQAQNEQNMGDL